MNKSPQELTPELRASLDASIAEQEAHAKPKFRELDNYRQYVCDKLDNGDNPMFIFRALKEQFRLSVSTDTFYRYVYYLRPRHKQNKKSSASKRKAPSRQPGSAVRASPETTASTPPTTRPRGPRIAPKDI